MSPQLECPKCKTIFLVEHDNKDNFALCPRCAHSLSMFDIQIQAPEENQEHTGEISFDLSVDDSAFDNHPFTAEEYSLASHEQTNILIDSEEDLQAQSFDQRMRKRQERSRINQKSKNSWNGDILQTNEFPSVHSSGFIPTEELNFSEIDNSFEHQHSLETEQAADVPMLFHQLESNFKQKSQINIQHNNFFSELPENAFDNLDQAFDQFSEQETLFEGSPIPQTLLPAETDLFSLAKSSDFMLSQKHLLEDSPKAPKTPQSGKIRAAHLSITAPTKQLISLPLENSNKIEPKEQKSVPKKTSEHSILTSKIETADKNTQSMPSLISLFSPLKVIFACSSLFLIFTIAGYFLLAPQKSAPTQKSTAEKHFSQGNHFYAESHYDDALAAYQKALDTRPEMYRAQKSIAAVYIKLGQAKKARQAYQKLISNNPNDVDIKRIQAILKDAEFLKGQS